MRNFKKEFKEERENKKQKGKKPGFAQGKQPIEGTMLTSDGANMFKFQVASVFNELFHRSKTINVEKMRQAELLYQKFSMNSKETKSKRHKQ